MPRPPSIGAGVFVLGSGLIIRVLHTGADAAARSPLANDLSHVRRRPVDGLERRSRAADCMVARQCSTAQGCGAVQVTYKGWLPDGTVFDAATTSFKPSQVTEGIGARELRLGSFRVGI
jgi:FKBP-type peptidyl-prolyl cis-trans isomerase